ncbi:MAG TPA: DNA mismatch repair endonuclease MutL [Pyrinomonadaceae bacterium]|nr:DNA mismatch repair endonuclease MutL [Pyrinomonadaceae bacterium]
MSKIRVLSDHLANQIAAGEVVERPASVAKELVENAVDAGARRVEVDVEAGGRRLLRVSDDGSGMVRDDALLAFERHATSKIAAVEDLNRIGTLGFRGEALASIASVARVELLTYVEGEEAATRVVIEGGRMRDVQPAARPVGTTIAVRDLFFNVPARRKFLRSEATESFHLTNLVTHYALAHPEIEFTLTNNGREVLRCAPARDLRERAYQIFGAEFLDGLLEVAGGHEQVARVSGFVSAPRDRRTSRDAQYLFVNGRYVRDRLISRALSEGYRTVLPTGVYPAALLFLEVPLEEVDVNVHPAKTEVRFRRAAAVADAVREAVRAALAAAGFVRERADFADDAGVFGETGDANAQQGSIEFSHDAPRADGFSRFVEEGARDRGPRAEEAPGNGVAAGQTPPHGFAPDSNAPNSTESGLAGDRPIEQVDAPPLSAPGAVARSASPLRESGESLSSDFDLRDVAFASAGGRGGEGAADAGGRAASALARTPNGCEAGESNRAPTAESRLPPLNSISNAVRAPAGSVSANVRPLFQLEESYIVAVDGEGLLMIDQHAAHERVLFDKYHALLGAREPESQQLLVPETFDLTPAQAAAFDAVAPNLEAYGFGLMRLSGRTVAVKAVPADLPPAEARNMLAEALEAVDSEKRGAARANLRERVAASLACRAAIKVNTPLAPEKMRWLIDRLLTTSSPTTCPHGRPAILRLTTRDIERGFHRP